MESPAFQKGVSLFNNHQFTQALAAFDQVINANPQDLAAYFNKAKTLEQLGRKEEALHVYDQCIQLDPTYNGVYYEKGVLLSALNRIEEALQAYEQSLHIQPDHASTYYNIACIFGRYGRSAEALDFLDTTLQLDPRHSKAHYNRGGVLFDLGRYQEALEDFDQALYIDPSNLYALEEKGNTLLALQYYEAALDVYKKILQVQPAKNSVIHNMQAAQHVLDNTPKDTAISNPVIVDESYNTMIKSLMNQKRYREALDQLEGIIALSTRQFPDPLYKAQFPSIYFNKGICLSQLERYPEALAAFEQVLRIQPGNTPALEAKAHILAYLHYDEAALSICHQLLLTDPGNQAMIQLISRISS
ncbi:tetratricopeptide repeat protein [Ktedonospora formicarum]|uniref:Tetratricopeptide repeat protein n=1 Tax=Ktedonospora formicarum TaxID=2778364 RepID=A0A8J3MWQ8_9CHLR|nr:tetratricopeptide repeat protein [Ktedonospora formicarum]GHO47840.1 hypothetical protein KSX_60030 [Ktedonospora formicarum]